MRESESFDAFYARSVRNVTDEMRSFIGDPEEAEQAVREAYAAAFQQWYEVSGYRDAEAWVLDTAKEAYRRRTGLSGGGSGNGGGSDLDGGLPGGPAGGPAGGRRVPGGPAGGPGFSAGIGAARTPALDPTTWASSAPWEPAASRGVPGQQAPPYGVHGQGDQFGGWGAPRGGVPANSTSVLGTEGDTAAAGRYPRSPRSGGQPLRSEARPNRVPLIITVAVIVIAIAVGGYLAFARHTSRQPARAGSGHPTKISAKPQAHMLPAGKVGSRPSIPWSLVGPGWTLAEVSDARPNANGGPGSNGNSALYLVDPKGGRYRVTTWTGTAASLVAWSGDKSHALLSDASTGIDSLVSLASGQIASLSLPPDVTIVGFTRPDGLALLAVGQHGARFQLQRYGLSGTFQATIDTMSRKPTQPQWLPGSCGSDCGALSSPDGLTDIWGTTWNQMRLVDNAGGHVHKLHLPGSSAPSGCAPLSWSDSETVVANCAPPGQPAQLWLVPVNGTAASPLTSSSASQGGAGLDLAASQVSGTWYVTQTSSTQCPSAPSGPGGLAIMQVAAGGTLTSVNIQGSTNTRNTVLAGVGARMLVLAQTACPGSYSLLSVDPSTGSSTVLLPAAHGQLGVTAAIPFGTW